MARPYSITNPAEGHYPSVGRIQLGLTAIAPQRPVYGTTLSCSCRERIGKVSNSAPSKGGRKRAQERYLQHLVDVGVVS